MYDASAAHMRRAFDRLGSGKQRVIVNTNAEYECRERFFLSQVSYARKVIRRLRVQNLLLSPFLSNIPVGPYADNRTLLDQLYDDQQPVQHGW